MAAVIANIAKGRLNEFARRVNGNDPGTSVFKVVLLQAAGLEAIGTLQDYDDLATLLAATNDEITVASYARQVLTDASIADPTVDDGANTQTWDISADVSFGALEAGQTVGAAVIVYMPDTAGADGTAIPVYIVVPAASIPLNGEIFWFRSPGATLWSAG
jgi:hypothetical protein